MSNKPGRPTVSRPRTASAPFTLSRKLPRLGLPASAATGAPTRPKPQVGHPGRSVFSSGIPPGPAPRIYAPAPRDEGSPPEADETTCHRCGHEEEQHPVRYVCDKYPHPDPLQICGCESEHLDEPCADCTHRAHWHKPRHRCRVEACHCWGFEG